MTATTTPTATPRRSGPAPIPPVPEIPLPETRGYRLKILYWDRAGLAIWAKRLERGTFRFPAPLGDRLEVTPAEMAAILEGIDLSRARRQRRFALPAAAPA